MLPCSSTRRTVQASSKQRTANSEQREAANSERHAARSKRRLTLGSTTAQRQMRCRSTLGIALKRPAMLHFASWRLQHRSAQRQMRCRRHRSHHCSCHDPCRTRSRHGFTCTLQTHSTVACQSGVMFGHRAGTLLNACIQKCDVSCIFLSRELP